MNRIGLAILALLVCSCERLPESYPPPEQRQPPTTTPDPAAMMVEMNDPDAPQHIVKDIYDFGSVPWRWSGKRPTVKVLVSTTENIKASIDFSVWDEGFKQTGPLELSFFVNDHLLDTVKYTRPGLKHFEKAVPPDWLSPSTESTIAIDVDKLYVAPKDGAKFGVILTRMGFVR